MQYYKLLLLYIIVRRELRLCIYKVFVKLYPYLFNYDYDFKPLILDVINLIGKLHGNIIVYNIPHGMNIRIVNYSFL